jgi:MFS family permease
MRPTAPFSGRVFHGYWVALVAVVAMFAATLTGGPGLSVFLLPISTDLGWDRKAIPLALTVGTVVGAFAAPGCGWLVDRYGARAMLTAVGLLLAATMLPIASITTYIPFFVFYSAARSVDMGPLNTAAPTAAANWFIRLRGRVLGLVVAGNAIGVAIQVPLAQWMISVWGWRTAWAILILFAVGLLTPLAWWLVRRRPEDLGLLPDGDAAPEPHVQRPTRRVEEVNWPLGAALRSAAFWLLVVSGAMSAMAVAGLSLHQIAILMENGFPAETASWVIGVYALWWATGSLVWGFLVERVSSRVALAAIYLVAGGCMLWLTQIVAIVPALIFATLYGLMNGGKETLDAVVWADYFGRASLGAIRGFSRPIIVSANAFGGLVAGVFYDWLQSYGTVIVVYGGMSLLAGLLVLLASRPRLELAADQLRTGPPVRTDSRGTIR